MLKLLIVDDEINICRLISKLVNWDLLELENAGTAYDGQSALALAETEKPDIVLTDIRMPNDDGLNFIRKCTQILPNTIFIIISGYHSFEYAKQAIKYGVFDFLTKPINQDDLNSTLYRACHTILKKQQNEQALAHFEAMTARYRSLSSNSRKELLNSLVHGTNAGLSSLQEINNSFGFNFLPGIFQAGAVYIDMADGSSNYIMTLSAHIEKIISDTLFPLCIDAELYTKDHAVIFLVNYEETRGSAVLEQYQEILVSARQYGSDAHSFSATVCLGSPCSEIQMLADSWSQCRDCINSRVLLGVNRIINYRRHLPAQKSKFSDTFPEQTELWKELKKEIELHNPEHVISACQSLSRSMLPFFKQHTSEIYTWYIQCLSRLQAYFREAEYIDPNFAADNMVTSDSLYECFTLRQLNTALRKYIEQIFSYYEEKLQNSDTKIIQMIKRYVQTHYGESLDLDTVAGQVFLSPAYLGILFKQKTGQNYTDYVMDVRIEKSKELLHDVTMSIAEISAAVGYKDVKYFSKLFKRKLGITPKEYRKISNLR